MTEPKLYVPGRQPDTHLQFAFGVGQNDILLSIIANGAVTYQIKLPLDAARGVHQGLGDAIGKLTKPLLVGDWNVESNGPAINPN